MSVLSSLRAATRPTRRDIRLHPRRLLAALLLIALPVALVIGYGVFTASDRYSQPLHSPERTLNIPEGAPHADAPFPARAAAVLPEGLHVAPIVSNATASVSLEGGGTEALPQLVQFDAENPPAEASALIQAFHPGPGEIFLPRAIAHKIGAREGDTVSIRSELGGTHQARVGGIIPGYTSVATAPAFIGVDKIETSPWLANWAIVGDRLLTSTDAEAAEKDALNVWAPELRDSASTPTSAQEALSYILWFLFAISLYLGAVIMILALTLPLFALITERNTRLYALMASQGARPAHIAVAVVTYGFLLGLIGGGIGAAAGVGIAMPLWAAMYSGLVPVFPWNWFLIAWAAAVVGGTVMSLGPAWLITRSALSAAIQGGAPDKMLRWRWWMAAGPAILAIAFIAAWFSVGYEFVRILWLIPFVGAGLCAPLLILAASRLSARGSLAFRLAGRSLTRRSMRAVPLCAALLLVSLAASMTSTTMSADHAKYRAEQLTLYPENTGLLQSRTYEGTTSRGSAAEHAAIEAATSIIPGTATPHYVFHDYSYGYGDPSRENYEVSTEFDFDCAPVDPTKPVENSVFIDQQGRRTDESAAAREECAHELMTSYLAPLGHEQTRYLQVESSQLDSWTFDSAEDRDLARRTLDAGGIVVAHSSHVGAHTEGKITARRFAGEAHTPEETTVRTLPIAEALPVTARNLMFISPDAAQQLEMQPTYDGALMNFEHEPNAKERTLLDDVIREASSGALTITFSTYNPSTTPWWPALLMGLTCALAALLSVAVAAGTLRKENSVFSALGADPQLMPRVAAWQMGLSSGIGLFAGVFLGHLGAFFLSGPPRELVHPRPYSLRVQDYFAVDWWIVAAAVLVPFIAAGAAWLVHRKNHGGDVVARDRSESRTLT